MTSSWARDLSRLDIDFASLEEIVARWNQKNCSGNFALKRYVEGFDQTLWRKHASKGKDCVCKTSLLIKADLAKGIPAETGTVQRKLGLGKG